MPPPQQQQQGDNSLAALWITLFFFAALGLLWYVFHDQIVWFILKLKYGELAFVDLFVSGTVPLTHTIGQLRPGAISVQAAVAVMTQVGVYIRYPLCFIMVVLAGVLFYAHPTLRFKKIYSMKSLLEQEKFNWPQIMPATKLNLVKEPLEKGPWSMAMTPMQFAKKNHLLYEERDASAKPVIGEMRERISVGLLRAEAHQAFAMQLGGYWQGVEKLPMHAKALFAVFASRGNRDQANAKAILDNASLSCVSGQMDFSGVDAIVNRYKDTALVKRAIERHGFVLSVMASMLDLARQDGVVAAADFLWLKTVDRPLWFMLNAVGRQTPPSEVAGPIAHWLAEKKLGRRISVPMVEEAVKALEAALKDVIYVPDKEER